MFEQRNQKAVVAGAVIPVAGTFRIAAVRGVGEFHHLRGVHHGAVDQPGAEFGVGVGADQRRGGKSAVADLGPVVGAERPAFLDRFRRFKPLLRHRVDQKPAFVFGQEVVKVIIADCQSHCHRRGVEEMFRIPVREGGGVHYLLDGAAGVLFVAGEFPRESEVQSAVQHGAGNGEQPFPFEFILHRGQSHDVIGVFHGHDPARFKGETLLCLVGCPCGEVDEKPSARRKAPHLLLYRCKRDFTGIRSCCGRETAAEQQKQR